MRVDAAEGGAYEPKSVCIGVLFDVFLQVPIRHPVRNELERAKSNAQEKQDIWVCQAFPHHSFLAECLDFVGGGEELNDSAHNLPS